VIQDLSEGRQLEANQQRFLANAAHQLRTPIMAIVGAAELLATGEDADPTIRRRLLNHIFSEGRRMQRLSEVLLRLSRIGWDRREPDLDIVDLGEAGQQVTKLMEPLAESGGIRILNEGEGSCVRADPEWLQEILMVVLSNAIKHSNRGGDIKVRARSGAITVQDEGAGISPVNLPHIFERFYKGTDSSEGFGEAALKRFRSAGAFDLVLLDLMLPGIDGISLCQELRKSSDVPVVMLTARDGERSVVLGLEVGADDYVTKPVSPLEIVSRVRAHLRRRRVDAPDQRLVFPGLMIDLLRRQVWVGDKRVDLTAAEFEVLRALAAHPGWVYSRQQIMEQLWDGEFYGEVRTADVHVRNIRRKLETDPKNPRYILTVRGMGYKFAEMA
jgi:DNA-binding response OmpR family regulator